MGKKLFVFVSILVVLSFVLAGCSAPAAAPAEEPMKEAPMEEEKAEEPMAEEKAEEAPMAEEAAAEMVDVGGVEYSTAYAGTTVTIFGVAADEQARLFQAEFDEFTEKTGIIVEYEGNKDFETLIQVRVEGGNPPDLAQFAQPAMLANFIRNGDAIDLSTVLDDAFLKERYSQGMLDLAVVDGKTIGAWHNADVKSLVWYPKEEFDAAGYQVPETWEDMIALSDQIVADGGTPWCIGMESAGATGWVGTDWIEDVMLRTTSAENYDKWTSGELKFDSPEVRNAFDVVGQIWMNEDYVYGGAEYILTTPFGDSPLPMFENPPKCYLHRQASFIKNFFPEDAVYGVDFAYFYLPPIDEAYGKPVLGSGAITGMFVDRPEVREVMKFLATGYAMKTEAEAGVAIAPQLDADPAWYPDEGTRGFGAIVQNASTFRFDGSDLMPSAVGAGTFWKGMVDWVSGVSLDEVLPAIDASWPEE